ncbi:MAG TPA: glycoside hydrolase family 2 protein [Kofleriaceae bacterium]|nr:glycoside hydrolase family 2 protein [Kofleriaceae bacterium]
MPIEHGWEVAPTPPGQLAGPHELDRVRWHPARVPGTAAMALPDRTDYDALDWWWRAPLNPELTAGCVLGFDGIATLWDAWIDGAHVASGESMWRAHEVALAHGAHELVIRCRSLTAELATKRPRPRWKVPMLEQQQLRWFRTTLLGRTPGWSPPWPAVGPWRSIWLEQRVHDVREVSIDARIEAGRGVIDVRGVDGTVVATRHGKRFVGDVPDPDLWWPHTHGDPALYRVGVECDGYSIDFGRIGFRTLELDDCRVIVNGVPIFCRGACWTPLDARALDGHDYGAAIAQCARAGMNMLRVGGTMTYEADAFYDACDAHGVLLWHDLMFANMDYPDELWPAIEAELREQAARWQARPSIAIICGNSEGEQQAAMFGATRARWAPALFREAIPQLLATIAPRVPYLPSSAHGGAFPHVSNVGPSSYYGVGAYRRPLDDARRAEVVFASECLAFANLGDAPPDKARTPHDLGAGWDFDDVRDHYVRVVFGVDPDELRATDVVRYLALGRVATGEVMQRTFAEWRRKRSITRGGLVWFLRDLWPCAGWGVTEADGRPKLAWYALRRAFAPLALAFTDEGTNGLALHVVNDRAQPIAGELELELWRGEARTGFGTRTIEAPARGALELAPTDWLDGFSDLSYAYRFGPPVADAIRARFAGAEAWWFLSDVRTAGLVTTRTGNTLEISTPRLARFVTIDAPGFIAEDNGFHLAPGQTRTIALEPFGEASGDISVTAL